MFTGTITHCRDTESGSVKRERGAGFVVPPLGGVFRRPPKGGATNSSSELVEVSARPARGPERLEVLQFIWIVFLFGLCIAIESWSHSVWIGLMLFWTLGLAGVGLLEFRRMHRKKGNRVGRPARTLEKAIAASP
jgi:hypothetical protein